MAPLGQKAAVYVLVFLAGTVTGAIFYFPVLLALAVLGIIK